MRSMMYTPMSEAERSAGGATKRRTRFRRGVVPAVLAIALLAVGGSRRAQDRPDPAHQAHVPVRDDRAKDLPLVKMVRCRNSGTATDAGFALALARVGQQLSGERRRPRGRLSTTPGLVPVTGT